VQEERGRSVEYTRVSKKDAHVVHQNGNLPVQVKNLFLQLDHLVKLANIRDDGRHIPSTSDGLDFLSRSLQELRVDVHHDDVHAGRGKVFRCGETNARAVMEAKGFRVSL
jgi:hypothetical protein